ncbi:Type I restriction-modification system, specificity subunit S [Candidatus Nitrotoga sp. BS]|uniref:restriction endonuclease subunit S n=1 Tax=Candidatus Nitrotoga sp. BS TaxID=2890408 RepID=UPI001EF2CCC0|nr:restriction endonuclease subunit S [Candidatus Nitrotoga sp. BS]CAH1192313.1 Type I restriction-modification system, specificity subunit S [Candidatus Nitrotoga sp. BS]
MAGKYQAYPDYRKTGVKWLAEIPANWDSSKLRYMFSFSKGLTITKEDLLDEGVPCVNYGEVHSKYGFEVDPDKHLLKCVSGEYLKSAKNSILFQGDLVFADTSEDIEGSGNFTQLTSDQVVFAGYHTIIARPMDRQSCRFYAYLLDSQEVRTQIRHAVKGVKVFSITQSILRGVEIWIPTLEERKKIANFLDHETAKIDTLIEKQQQLIKLLIEKRQAVISHAVTKGLNLNAPMCDSGVEWLGEVPTHWVVAQLKFNTLEMQTGPFGSQLHAEDYIIDGIPLINPAHMINGKIIHDSKVTVDEQTQERLKRHKLSEGDLILARRGELGRCAIVTKVQEGWLCGTGSLKAKLNERLLPEYSYLLITSEGVVSELALETKGSTMDNLNTETLGRIRVPVPPINEQKGILNYVHEIGEKYKLLTRKAAHQVVFLQERRTALISAAVTGKIDVRDWQTPNV